MCHMHLDAAKEGGVPIFLSLNTCFLEFEIAVGECFNKLRNVV